MRVALIAPPFESVPPRLYGGTERVVYNLCRGLAEEDVEVTLFASGDSTAESKIVPTMDEAMRLKKQPVTDAAPYHLRMLSQVRKLAHEFDIIHNHHDYWMLPLSEMVSAPLLTTLHGRLDLVDPAVAYHAFPNCWFTSISQSQRAPLPMLRWVRTVLHGIAPEDFEFYPKPGDYLAFLGRIHVDKRPEWAIQIAMKAGIPLKIAAKIEGADGQAYYNQHIKPWVDGKNVEYVGEISEREKCEFLGNALGLVFPIDWPEPFGMVLIESLACGTPVLARPCGAVPEILKDQVTGFIESGLDRLAQRAHDLPLIDRKRCRSWVEERFSLKRMTEDYIDVYRELTETAELRRYARRSGRAVGDRRNLLYPL